MLAKGPRLPFVHISDGKSRQFRRLQVHDILNPIVSLHSVLLVDSDPEVHRVLAGSLTVDGRRIDDIYDGHEALAQLRAAHYDVLVAGAGQNGLDGLKLLRRARAIRSDLKVIVTGEPDPARVLSAIRHRAYSYIHKPFAAGPVADLVQQALDASAWKDDIRVVSGRPEWVTLGVEV